MATSIDSLPVESHLQILENLGCQSRMNLRACSRHYRDLPALVVKKPTDSFLKLERISAEAHPKRLFLDGRLPCYRCLRLLPRVLYCSSYLEQRRCTLGKTRAAKRICQECHPGHDPDHLRRSKAKAMCNCWVRLHPGKIHSCLVTSRLHGTNHFSQKAVAVHQSRLFLKKSTGVCFPSSTPTACADSPSRPNYSSVR